VSKYKTGNLKLNLRRILYVSTPSYRGELFRSEIVTRNRAISFAYAIVSTPSVSSPFA